MKSCQRCWVSGTVQGVWYRASARDKARELELTGYARNLDDGRVEVVACGKQDAIEQFKAWLWEGPSQARVTDVQCQHHQDDYDDFTAG
ncbi:MAG: acylphosphatase [Candidatus Competibacteraceae bacterium]|nr:acylphosphatase [Candidatus Competibacteraceae bacterium]